MGIVIDIYNIIIYTAKKYKGLEDFSPRIFSFFPSVFIQIAQLYYKKIRLRKNKEKTSVCVSKDQKKK